MVQYCTRTGVSCQLPTKSCKYLALRYIFWFFLTDEAFVSKAINDSSIALEKFPASKVMQLAKRIKASKATAHHIKQVVNDPKATQVSLMRNQRKDLPPSKHKKKSQSFKSRPSSHKRYSSEHNQHQVPPYKKKFDPKQAHSRKDRYSKSGDSKHIEGFKCPAKGFQCKICNKYGHFTSLHYKKSVSFKSRTPKVHQLQAGQMYTQEDSTCGQSEDLTSSDESFCLQLKIQCTQASSKIPTPHHLITNIAYRLKSHQKGNQYLRARLDTYANVSIMPASVYQLVFQDLDCKKLTPNKPEIGTYTTDTVKLVGSCVFHLVHPDTKCLQEVTFYVASNNGSVWLSCVTMLALGLIQPCTRLDYLPPRASLITSSSNHAKKTKSQVNVCVSKKEYTVSNQQGIIHKLITTKVSADMVAIIIFFFLMFLWLLQLFIIIIHCMYTYFHLLILTGFGKYLLPLY